MNRLLPIFILMTFLCAAGAGAQAPEFTYLPPQRAAYWLPPPEFTGADVAWKPPAGYEKYAHPWAPPEGWETPVDPWAPPQGWQKPDPWAPPPAL